ncbi:carbohydrate sulfotransferase 1-like [Oppia nitens]|uniref:carbohydrate sulfotransferase 1-like n=1 Tax=Oppia nitens TaxID=1686743 RepID=UPI0023DC4A28|nr:carbohydrate sulfotransferase 1-like [Oppia nitens]
MTNSRGNRDSAPNWSEYPVVGTDTVNKIIIVTEARSGSTFLGDLLQQSWPTFYNFEPLITMRVKNPRTDQSTVTDAVKLLTSLLDCQFTALGDHYLRPVFWKVPYFSWNLAMKDSVRRDQLQYFNATLNQYVCNRCRHRLIKTIRFGVEDYLQLKQKSKTPVKLVFLVRDPRGVMSSRYRMQWCLNSPNCTDVDVLCQRMRSDISALIQMKKWSKDNVTVVRYEDLSLKPFETTRYLYENLGLQFTPAVEQWLAEHTITDDILANPHSTIRNSRLAPLSWIPRMSVNDVLEVQEFCYDVMQHFGYKIVDNLDYDYNDTKVLDNYTLDQILDLNYSLKDLL